MKRTYFFTLLLCVGCSTQTGTVTPDTFIPDTGPADISIDLLAGELPFDIAAPDFVTVPDLAIPDFAQLDVPADTGPACEAGQGCFLDPCLTNDDCLSGWCVGHMGETVCTVHCESECPQGWGCQQVSGAVPDLVWICVSPHANLCLPCDSLQGCQGAAKEDVCLDYGEEGAFCGAPCQQDEDCPWGFSCAQAMTTDGVEVTQCVADAGVCPCSKKAVDLALFTPCQTENEFGTCAGKRVCTEAGLSSCDAAKPQAETCDGVDNDCDNDIDEPDAVDGQFFSLCDDENPCTEDLCKGVDGCQNVALEEGECIDGDPCTVADHCVAGVCTGDPVQCDDENPCTEDLCTATGGCEYPPAAGECDDLDPCTLGDHCAQGQCQGEAVNCQCQQDADCQKLEDGDLCNGTLYCDLSAVPFHCAVAPDTVVECPLPDGPDAPCLQSVCDPETGQCGFQPTVDGAPCEDGDMCTLPDTCLGGQCQAGQPANCNDGNSCTDDSCQAASGCVHLANDAPCSDGDVCTVGDVCQGAQCTPGNPLNCDDGDGCTDDACDPDIGCEFTPNQAQCDDGNHCTDGDVCQGGQCAAGTPLNCADDNPCTTDSCDPAIGCVSTLNDDPCNDDNICTINDHCHLGGCIGSADLVCNDLNPCTDDGCQAAVGCTFTANDAQCDDGTMCTVGDHCEDGMCKPAGILQCDDKDPCTDDFCDPGLGCQAKNNENPCDDGDLCTVVDQCTDGQCVGSGQLNCNDGNVCTDDSCVPESGCLIISNQDLCDDDNLCTPFDQCSDAQCVGSGQVVCNDSNPCTDEQCIPDQGCVETDNQAPCDDGSLCTLDDQCADGQCQPGTPLPCDDENDCTVDSCDPDSGCLYVDGDTCCGNGVIDDGEQCDDGNDNDSDFCNNQCQFSGSVFSQYQSAGRTVYIFKSDSNIALTSYDNFCQSLGLQWWVPVSSPDAQTLLEHCHNLDGGHHTWIIQKNNTSQGQIGGFSVQVNGPGCSSFSNSGFSAVRWQWACAFCDPEQYNVTKCWDSGHTYDWLACQGG